VPPGKEGRIELAVEHTEGLSGDVAKSAGVTTNDPKTPNFTLFLRARFIGAPGSAPPPPPPLNNNIAFTVDPSDRYFASALSGSSSSSTLRLNNNQEDPTRITKIVPGGDTFTATLQTIQEGRQYAVIVASNSALKPGHYTQILKALTDSKAQPEVSIQLDLTVFPKVFVSPPSITMPTLSATADLSSITWPVIYVRKVREQGLQIKKYSSTLPFIKLELLTETEGQVYKIQLKLDSSKIKPGEFKGKVIIETNDPDVPVAEVPIQATYK